MPTELLVSIAGVAYLCIQLLAFVAAIYALVTTRTSQGAIAWGISLVAMPLISLPLYLVFGRGKFAGYIKARRAGDAALQLSSQPDFDRTFVEHSVEFDAHDERLSALERLADGVFTHSNSASLQKNGQATFDAIFDGIDQAERYVLVQFFIVRDDSIGWQLHHRLVTKAQQGVQVYFLYDFIGSHALPVSFLDSLNAAGVQVEAFRSSAGHVRRFQINFRNHRKIVVVDGHTAYLGGHNVGDDYLGGNPRLSPWRDTHVKITGPAALAAQLAFLEDWNWATQSVPDLNWQAIPASAGNMRALILSTGPADDMETCRLFFVYAINASRKRCWIVSPYFVPDESVVSALQLAALRGVDVRIMLPEKPDHRLVYLAAFSYFKETIDAGVRLYRYQAGFLHQKVMLIDDELASVGTANLDNRSFRLNFEITAVLADKDFAGDVSAMLVEDFSNCREISVFEFENRSWLFRLAVRAVRLLSPVL